MKKVGIGCLALIGSLFIIGVIIAAIGGQSNKTHTELTAPSITEQQVEESATKTVNKEYNTVVELSGNSEKNSDTFQLTGGKVKLSYDFKGNTTIIGAIYLLEEGTDLIKEGGFPEVTVSQAGSDSTILRKNAGMYFLSVKSANSSWTVKLEEER